MKIPKSFRMEKNLDEKIKDLVDGDVKRGINVNKIFEAYEKFCYDLSHTYKDVLNHGSKYTLAKGMIRKIGYVKEDIEIFCDLLQDPPVFAGFFISALVNKVIKEYDIINLKLGVELSGSGLEGTLSVLRRHRLIVQPIARAALVANAAADFSSTLFLMAGIISLLKTPLTNYL